MNPGNGLPWKLTVNGGQRILDLNLLRLDTVGHLILLECFLTGRPIRGMRVRPKWIARPFRAPVERPGAPPITAQDLRHPDAMLAALIELKDSIPQVWLEAARRHMDDQACPTHPLCLANRLADAVDTLGRTMVMMPTGSNPVMLSAVSVKGLTTLFSATALAKKVQKITAHVAAVDIPPTMRAQWTPERMFKVLERMAKLPFANRIKEPFWLLVYNGVHVQSRYASTPDRQRRCRCGSQDDSPSAVQDLPHAFWQCPVAQDIRSLIQHHLRECGVLQSTAELTQANLWLAITPGAMATWVWDVTAAVTIYGGIYIRHRPAPAGAGLGQVGGVGTWSPTNQGANKGSRGLLAGTRVGCPDHHSQQKAGTSAGLLRPSVRWPSPLPTTVSSSRRPSHLECLGVSHLRFSSATFLCPLRTSGLSLLLYLLTQLLGAAWRAGLPFGSLPLRLLYGPGDICVAFLRSPRSSDRAPPL